MIIDAQFSSEKSQHHTQCIFVSVSIPGIRYHKYYEHLLYVSYYLLHLFWIAKQGVKITGKLLGSWFFMQIRVPRKKSCFYKLLHYYNENEQMSLTIFMILAVQYGKLDSYLSLWCGTEVLCLHRVHYRIIPAQEFYI